MTLLGLEPTPVGDPGLPLHNRLIKVLAARSDSLHDVVTTIWSLAGAMNEHLAMAAYNRMDAMLRQRGELALHHTLFRRLRADESAHKSFYWSVAADTWQRLQPWQRRLARPRGHQDLRARRSGWVSRPAGARAHGARARSRRLERGDRRAGAGCRRSAARRDRTVRAAGLREMSHDRPAGHRAPRVGVDRRLTPRSLRGSVVASQHWATDMTDRGEDWEAT